MKCQWIVLEWKLPGASRSGSIFQQCAQQKEQTYSDDAKFTELHLASPNQILSLSDMVRALRPRVAPLVFMLATSMNRFIMSHAATACPRHTCCV